jgi:hypothetical protein
MTCSAASNRSAFAKQPQGFIGDFGLAREIELAVPVRNAANGMLFKPEAVSFAELLDTLLPEDPPAPGCFAGRYARRIRQPSRRRPAESQPCRSRYDHTIWREAVNVHSYHVLKMLLATSKGFQIHVDDDIKRPDDLVVVSRIVFTSKVNFRMRGMTEGLLEMYFLRQTHGQADKLRHLVPDGAKDGGISNTEVQQPLPGDTRWICLEECNNCLLRERPRPRVITRFPIGLSQIIGSAAMVEIQDIFVQREVSFLVRAVTKRSGVPTSIPGSDLMTQYAFMG